MATLQYKPREIYRRDLSAHVVNWITSQTVVTFVVHSLPYVAYGISFSTYLANPARRTKVIGDRIAPVVYWITYPTVSVLNSSQPIISNIWHEFYYLLTKS